MARTARTVWAARLAPARHDAQGAVGRTLRPARDGGVEEREPSCGGGGVQLSGELDAHLHAHSARARCTCGAAREVHAHAHAVQVQVHMRARLTVPASMSNEPGAATSSNPPGPRKTDRSAASPATETTTVEARLHSSSRLHGWVKG